MRIWPEKPLFFEGWSSFKFNNFGLALGMTLKFYTSVSKGLRLKFEKFWGTYSTVCRSYKGKAGMRSLFDSLSPSSWIGLKVNVNEHQMGSMLFGNGMNPLSKWLLKPCIFSQTHSLQEKLQQKYFQLEQQWCVYLRY